MIKMGEHKGINRNVSTKDGQDFSFLKQKGITYIEELSGALWTDYNTHDPGITILEMLIYAITDLSARIELPVEDILALEGNKDDQIAKNFFEAHEILPSRPVSESDYRKLFIDIKGVNNCWVLPYKQPLYINCKTKALSYIKPDEDDHNITTIKGLYKVLVDFEEGVQEDEVIENIKKRFHENRNLCEDLAKVTKVPPFDIIVCGNIELENDADKEGVNAKVIWEIEQYFSPSLNFLTLEEMQKRGYSTEEIYEGPLLEHGFVDPKEFMESDLRKEVRLSDLINIIMQIDGVKVIKDLQIKEKEADTDHKTDEKAWVICIPEGRKPVLCDDFSVFSYFKDVLPLNIEEEKTKKHYEKLKEEKNTKSYEVASASKTLTIPEGIYRNIDDTTTIQNDFPETYGIGLTGLPSAVSEKRKVQAKQLKAYLLFFDQILATYFAHLSKVKEVFSVNQQLKHTYFTQAVQDIKDFDELINKESYPQENIAQLTEILFNGLDESTTRSNKILDHLLGRFAEKFGEYAFLMNRLYGAYSDELTLRDKRKFLEEYDVISQNRGKAFDYYKQPESRLWNTDNVSGFQKRIARLTGITNYNRRDLSSNYDQGSLYGSFLEVYKLKGKYRWRFRDSQPKIVLTSTEAYSTIESAEREIYLVLTRIMETSEETIEAAFKKDSSGDYLALKKGLLIGNLQVRLSESKRYSFNVIDPEGTGKDWIIARQFSYYKKVKDFKASILDFIKFIKNRFSEEGMFVIENILLRPEVDNEGLTPESFLPAACDEVEKDCSNFDPFSYRVTIVLPGWTMRFWDMDYRKFLENLIRRELPAHILPRICWIGSRNNAPSKTVNKEDDNHNSKVVNQMESLEQIYKEFLLDKTETGDVQDDDKPKKLIEIINNLNSIYPSGHLIDCDTEKLSEDEEEDDLKRRIFLGRTKL